MEKRHLTIDGIPAILWGTVSDKLFIAVHGDQSHKQDLVIELFAQQASRKGYQTLSFDLPEHGERSNKLPLCKVNYAVEDLIKVMDYARHLADNMNLFACSIGAYFSMLAYKNQSLQQTLYLSPVVDMQRIINNMMKWFNISVEQLQQKQEIQTPIKTLYWDYYKYVIENPIDWHHTTAILYGAKDNLCEFDDIEYFAHQCPAELTIYEEGEHYFHTSEQLTFFNHWLANKIQ